MTDTLTIDPRIVALAVETEMAMGYERPGAYKHQAVEYINRKPKKIEVQIPFVEYFERVKRVKADRWQYHFCDYLQSAVENRLEKQSWAEFHAQAQLGKTSAMSQCFPAWCIGHDPLWQTILAMYNQSRSEAHSSVVLQILKSPMHRDIFPNKDGWPLETVSKSGWMTNARRELNDGQNSFSPAGLMSGITGTSADLFLVDDPYKEPKDAFSETVYENLERFWLMGIEPRLRPWSLVFAMFHRYSYDDFGGYLLNTGRFDYVRYASIADGPYLHDETGQRFEDPLGREKGELICPERFPASYYENKQADTKVWLSMFQGRPGRDEGDFFKVDHIGEATETDWLATILKGRGWDHAATQGRGDNSAGSLGGMLPDETCVFKDIFSGQLSSENRVAKQQELAESDGPDVSIIVPEGIGADGKDNVFLMQQNLRGFNVVARKVTNASPGSDAKKRRAYNLSIAVNSGKVKFMPGPWVDRVKRLMRRFGSSLSGDDEIDAMADTYNHLIEEFYKGLVVKNLSLGRNFINWQQFAEKCGPVIGENGTRHKAAVIPAHWIVYAGIKITAEASMPNSAVLVARAAENTNMADTLFVVDEYKEYTSDYEKLFEWLDKALATRCENSSKAVMWLHPDSSGYVETMHRKLKRIAHVFEGVAETGIAEMNWYIKPRESEHPFNAGQQASGLYALVGSDSNLYQEALTWGHKDGKPTGSGAVADCLRMVASGFRTYATRLTTEERAERDHVHPRFRSDAIQAAADEGATADEIARLNMPS
jgi:phage terminase large subunit-like protein